MATWDPKADLHGSLRAAREAVLWKLEGLSELDARRPLTPTGTNLLGLVKHLAGVEVAYFGDTFGRPLPDPLPWTWGSGPDADPHVDLWATADEPREQVLDLYRRAREHADATITALPLEATGRVPHWPGERAEVSLHRVLVHVVAETHRHAGHADVVRELIDGAVGRRAGSEDVAPGDRASWAAHRERVQRAAEEAGRT